MLSRYSLETTYTPTSTTPAFILTLLSGWNLSHFFLIEFILVCQSYCHIISPPLISVVSAHSCPTLSYKNLRKTAPASPPFSFFPVSWAPILRLGAVLSTGIQPQDNPKVWFNTGINRFCWRLASSSQKMAVDLLTISLAFWKHFCL